MKKFTTKITKAVLTFAAILAFNAFNAYAGDEPYPEDTRLTFNKENWGAAGNVYTSGAMIQNSSTSTFFDNVGGKFINNGWLLGNYGYGAYLASDENPGTSTEKVFTLENNGEITSSNNIGVAMKGTQGTIVNEFGGSIYGYHKGIWINPTANSSWYDGFNILNYGIISGADIGIYSENDYKTLRISNLVNGLISGHNQAINLAGQASIYNAGSIISSVGTTLTLKQGGKIENYGDIQNLVNPATGLVERPSIRSGDNLTLIGDGTYQGNIEFDPTINPYQESESELQFINNGPGTNLKDYRLVNWASVYLSGNSQYFTNIENTNGKRTNVYVNDGSMFRTGNMAIKKDPIHDANIFVQSGGTLSPYENNYGDYWDKSPRTYDKREFERLTVNNLTMVAGSSLTLDIRDAKANFDEDYWITGYGDSLRGHSNPDGTYGGYGKTSYKHGNPSYPHRINHDLIEVKGTGTFTGAILNIVDYTVRSDFSQSSTVEDAMDALHIDLLDGNIAYNSFSIINFYSDIFSVEKFDNETGVLTLTSDHKINQQGIVDWYLDQVSANLDRYTNDTEQSSMNDGELQTTVVATTPQTTDATTTSQSGSIDPTVPAGASFFDPSGIPNTAVIVDENEETGPASVEEDTDPTTTPDYSGTFNTYRNPNARYMQHKDYSALIIHLNPSDELRDVIYSLGTWNDLDAFMDSINKLEYASLATSNLNMISNRVGSMYNRLGAGYDLRDDNNISVWSDVYLSNDSLDGKGNHGIDGQGTEFAVGIDKLFNEKFTLGMSFNRSEYESTVNDSGIHDTIESDGYGLNVYAMIKQGALTHKMMVGYAAYENTNDDTTFNSDEMFVAYRAEYTIIAGKCEIKPLAGIRYSKVSFDEIREDAENGLAAFDQDSLETELGVELSRQFKRLGVSVSGAWMHELLDSQTTAQAFTSFGNFSQDGIARDTDSFRATIGFEYQLTDKVTLDFDYAKEMGNNSESDSVNGKITFRF